MQDLPALIGILAALTVGVVSPGPSFVMVALALASERPRSVYLRCKAWVDRLAGGVMIGLGLKLASSAQR